VGEFIGVIEVIGVGNYRFMRQPGGGEGASSDTYIKAYRFFKKRKTAALGASKSVAGDEASLSSSGTPTLATLMSAIELPGESTDSVKIYDSCGEIRRKINAHLRKPDVTQAAFLRDLEARFRGPRKPKKLLAN